MSLASLDQLDRSHRRHDDVMTQLLDAARRLAAGRPHDTDVNVVRDAVAYFERAVTRHFLDEEGSVFPRLSTRRPELAEALASLSAEHPAQIALQNAVAECVKQLDDESRPGAGKALLEIAEKLADQHRKHIEREDEIFRTAHEALTEQDDTDIVAEMETRRDRDSEDSGRIRAGGGGGGGGGGRGRGGGGGGGGGQKPAAAAKPASKPAKKTVAKAKPAAKSAKTTKQAAKTARSASKPKTSAKKSAKPAKKSAKKKR
ncbi:MAG TPA: hemerythrin domain-containing protein [Kofleriaceae bacterium]|nr:hemerythrin domain-containing protein [Kofleriaceae bacterium]